MSAAPAVTDWKPDFLAGYEQAPLGEATLVRRTDAPLNPRGVALHVHGYNDYFFQTHLADAFADAGLAFYAVDMRRAGRSLREGDSPHDMADVAEPGEDIGAAARELAAHHPGLPLVIHAHSTGALSAAIWAADRPDPALAGLILNSPLFGRRFTVVQRLGMPALPVLAARRPRLVVSNHPSVYAKHLHVSGGGRWDFDLELKSPAGVVTRASWAGAVARAQQRVAAGLDLTIPVLAARSASTGPERDDNPRLDEQDIVVDVDAIARLAPRLGSRVSELVVEGGIHDLSLSADEPRAAYLNGVRAWIDEVLS